MHPFMVSLWFFVFLPLYTQAGLKSPHLVPFFICGHQKEAKDCAAFDTSDYASRLFFSKKRGPQMKSEVLIRFDIDL